MRHLKKFEKYKINRNIKSNYLRKSYPKDRISNLKRAIVKRFKIEVTNLDDTTIIWEIITKSGNICKFGATYKYNTEKVDNYYEYWSETDGGEKEISETVHVSLIIEAIRDLL